MTKFALLIALALACGEAGALNCSMCHSVDSLNPDCEDGLNSKYVMECPTPPTGQTARCGKIDGLYKIINPEEMPYHLERACVPFSTKNLPENKCYTDEEGKFWILEAITDPSKRQLLDASFTFKGKVCFCNTDQCNSVASVQPFLVLLVAAVGLYVMGVWR